MKTRIHWFRALLGGFLAEVFLIAAVIPTSKIYGQHALLFFVPPAAAVLCFLFAFWVARKVESRFLLHGIIVGVVATVIYVALTRAGPEPFAYILANALKILGGMGGAMLAGRRRVPSLAASP